ncbi:MAG: DUF4290 domain-containing protein [Marinilabiliales bacterium]
MMKDYNTQRKKLPLPEYGRNIHKMVDYIKTIEDREERNKMAKALINIMSNLNPQFRDVADFKSKLWDHLAIMSNYELDIDYPHPIPEPKLIKEKPNRIPYNKDKIDFLHYGKNIVSFINYAADMEDGEEKQYLIETIANHMKKTYLMWNKESVSDEQIFKDIKTLSNGRIVIDDMTLNETRDILNRNKKTRRQSRKKQQ